MPFRNNFLFFGTKPRFHVQGNTTFPSHLNTFLSILFILCFLIVFLLYFIQLISLSDLNIATTIFKDISPLRINVSDPNFVFTFSLQHQNYSNFIDESIYKVNAYFVQVQKDINNINQARRQQIELVTCDKVYIPILPNYFNKLPLDQLYCFKNDSELFLEGSISAPSWSYIEFNIEKCKGHICKEEQEIIDVLSGSYIGFFMSDYFANPTNYKHPAKLSGTNYYCKTSVRLYNEIWLFFQTIQFETDDNLLLRHNHTQQFFSSEKQVGFTDIPQHGDVFLKVFLRASESRYIYYRRYGKFDEILAKVYCLWRTAGFVTYLLVYYFEGLLYKSFICSFYSFDYGSLHSKTYITISNNNYINGNINIINNPAPIRNNSLTKNNNNNNTNNSKQVTSSINNSKHNNLLPDCLFKKAQTLKNFAKNKQQQQEQQVNGSNAKMTSYVPSPIMTNENMESKVDIQQPNVSSQHLQTQNPQVYNVAGSYLSSLFRKRDMIKQFKEYGYKTNSFACCDLMKFCCCDPMIIRKVRFVERSAQNVKIYFDIVRYLKLYSDVDALLRAVFEDKQCKQIERSYNFIKNSEFTVKFFGKDFKSETKNNQKSMIQNMMR